MKFNFKSSGKKVSDSKYKITESVAKSKIVPIGIKTPVSFGEKKNKLFKMNEDPVEQLKDNLRNLIQTNKGERLGRFDIGCNLKSLLFERVGLDENFNRVATEQIIDQVKIFIPAINIDNIEYSVSKKEIENNMLSEIIISILFSVPVARISNKRLDVKLACGG